MTKTQILILFALAEILDLFVLGVILRKKSKTASQMRVVLFASILTMSSYMLTILVDHRMIEEFFYNLYFASMTFLCFTLLKFILSYCGYSKEVRKLGIYKILIVLASIDEISILCNLFFHHVATYTAIEDSTGSIYLNPVGKFPFLLHISFCYLMIGVVFIVLIYKIIRNARFYRSQYITILCMLIILVLSNAMYLATKLYLDVSIIGYGIVTGTLAYYTVFYVPNSLRRGMSDLLVDQMGSSLLLYDEQKNLIRENQLAVETLNPKLKNVEYLMTYAKIDIQDETDEHQIEYPDQKGDLRTYQIVHHCLYNQNSQKENERIGYFFLITDITERKKIVEEKEYALNHDALTGLYSRAFFYDQARGMVRTQTEIQFCAVLFSIQHLDTILDLYGENEVDSIVVSMADYLKTCITSPFSIYARYDWNHFALIGQKELVYKNVLPSLESEYVSLMERFRVQVYGGIYEIPDSSMDLGEALAKATLAMKQAVAESKERVRVYDDSIRQKMLQETEMLNLFPIALRDHEFEVFVQPQVDSRDGSLVGGEALVRWRHKSELISPGVFIDLLEQNTMLTALDEYVWEESAKLIREMMDEGHPISISVNISAGDFIYCDLYDTFTMLTDRYEIPRKLLKLEITETIIASDLNRVISIVKNLQEAGFIVEMDDFGSAYSSLNALQSIPVNVLKLDMGFFHRRENSTRSNEIVAGMIALAQNLNLPVIAEGVEKEEQAEHLKQLKSYYIQGYLYSKPLPKDEFKKFAYARNYHDLFEG